MRGITTFDRAGTCNGNASGPFDRMLLLGILGLLVGIGCSSNAPVEREARSAAKVADKRAREVALGADWGDEAPPGQALQGRMPPEELAALLKIRLPQADLLSIEAVGSGQGGGKGADSENLTSHKAPQVWKRDRSRPTFARVYVGDGNSLELVSLHVSVTIEGPRARTVVDHVFRNPHNRQLEGTFEYPLPSGASPSYFAMFLGQTRDTAPALFNRRGGDAPLPADALARLTPEELVKHVDTADWGRLQEARIVGKEKALETYEEVVRGRIDPALLEYAGGNTFSGRVFPIPPKGYNRVLLAYEELLPIAQEYMLYRFPLPNCKLSELQFTLEANAAECLKSTFLPKDASKQESNGRIIVTRTWKDARPEGEFVFACTPANPQVQTVSGRQGDNGPRYAYARIRPQLKTVAKNQSFASHAVFLLDTSLS